MRRILLIVVLAGIITPLVSNKPTGLAVTATDARAKATGKIERTNGSPDTIAL